EHRFTDTADASARIVVQNALLLDRKRVGIYVKQACERGIPVKTFTVSSSSQSTEAGAGQPWSWADDRHRLDSRRRASVCLEGLRRQRGCAGCRRLPRKVTDLATARARDGGSAKPLEGRRRRAGGIVESTVAAGRPRGRQAIQTCTGHAPIPGSAVARCVRLA